MAKGDSTLSGCSLTDIEKSFPGSNRELDHRWDAKKKPVGRGFEELRYSLGYNAQIKSCVDREGKIRLLSTQ